jgi:hypothetical protein
MTEEEARILVSALAAVAAVASAVVAVAVARMHRRKGSADAFIQLSSRFELEEFRNYRITIYQLDRHAYGSWNDDEKRAVDAWCAHLDLVAVLVRTGQLDRVALLDMYGDVIMRTLYQIAPYCNAQVKHRGTQFLLPVRKFTGKMVRLWRKQAIKRQYPLTIGFPSQSTIRVNPDLFDSDDEILEFRTDRKAKR